MQPGAPPPGAMPPPGDATPGAAPPPAGFSFQLGSDTGADMDTVMPESSGAKPLIWRGTTFTFNQAGTTTIFGIGRDNIGSEGEFYGWDFTFRPNVYLLDRPKDQVIALAEIGWATELTNSDTTADYRETQFKDLQLGIRYKRTFWESGGANAGEYVTSGNVTLRGVLPTSPTSYDQGKYLTLAIGPALSQQIKLLGTKADGLNNITVGLNLTYSHLFSRSYTPTNGDLQQPRQNATGATIFSDQLGLGSFDIDRLTTGVTFDLPLYKDLSLATAFRIISRWKHDFEAGAGSGCDVMLATGCVEAERLEDRALYHTTTTFDLALSYPVYEVVDLTLGYNNETRQIGEDGQRRNFFYSPDAQFYLDITANLDVIYSKITRRDQPAASAGAALRKREF